jgi:hypothetical protein
MAKKKTDKQRVFVEQYLKTWNATLATELAGYKGTYESMRVIGSQNLTKPHIAEHIEKRMKELTLSADEVLLRLGQHATASISDFIDDAGVIDWKAVKKKGYLIKKIVHRKGQQSVIELHDPQSAIVHMGRHYKLFTDKIKIEDWRHEFIQLIREGKLDYKDVREEIGADLASELFESAGVSISQT